MTPLHTAHLYRDGRFIERLSEAGTDEEARDENPMWAPDGRHIILQSIRDGNFEVYQVDPDGGRPVRLTDHPAGDGWACYLPVKKR